MSQILGPTEDNLVAQSAALDAAIAEARRYVSRSASPATLRAYRADWRAFSAWCAQHQLPALPATEETVAIYLASLGRSLRRTTLQRRVAGIAYHHHLSKQPFDGRHPAIRATLRGIARTHVAQQRKRKAAALLSEDIRKIVACCDDSLAGLRDRAMLLVGFAAALRRAELVALEMEDVRSTSTGMIVTIRSSKTDADAEGVELAIPRGKWAASCPVRSLNAWLARAGITHGPLFRKVDRWGRLGRDALDGAAVRQILRKHAGAAGIKVPAGERLSPHGLRAGMITEAIKRGVKAEQVQPHSRHKRLGSLQEYIRASRLEFDSPAHFLDL